MDPDGRRIDIWHCAECRCWIDGDAIYVGPGCYRFGNHITKRRLAQLLHALRRRFRKDTTP